MNGRALTDRDTTNPNPITDNLLRGACWARELTSLLALAGAIAVAGCGDDSDPGTDAGSGATGAVGTGGAATGGTVPTGGAATGGTVPTGGAVTGGSFPTGGAIVGGTGGSILGGSGGSGGAMGGSGGTITGGTSGSGGVITGGTSGTGGVVTGGTSGTGGVVTGGTSGTGGVVTGGTSGSGGVVTGGTGGATGGTGGTGGATGGTGGETTGGTGGQTTTEEWLPSWATTMQRSEERNTPSAMSGMTLRQFVWPSYSGSEIRIQLSNEKGNGPVDINKVHIAQAQPLGSGQIDTATDTEFTFGGSVSVTIPQGETAWSDPLAFDLREMEPTAVTMHLGNVPSYVTGHPGARTTSYLANGDVVSQASVSGETWDRWYFINAIEVMAPADAFAIAALGDSITDGYGVLNAFARWPDFLTAAIKQDPQIADKVSVLNFGAGANSLLSSDGYMDAGVDRVDRDILARPKVKWVIVLHGVNDILYGDVPASQITAGYQQIVDKCHPAGILVYGSPITPFASHSQSNASRLSIRSEVNSWVTSSSSFDAVIDFAAILADPSNQEQLNPPLSNDGLHPNTSGYQAMGEGVDLSLFYSTM